MVVSNQNKTILLVEDEADLVSVIKFRLQTHGYKVITAENGVVALAKLTQTPPDLIILDINLPRMSGIEFYRQICTSYGHSKYPVLVLTARANLEKLFKDIEADGFMAKPFEVDVLIKEIDRILSGASNPGVFLVDYKDNPHVRAIAAFLKAERYNVIYIESLAQLKEEAARKKPRFIIMEYMQEEMSGEAFIGKVKKDPILGTVPLIVYSYSGFAEYEEKSIRAGADRFLGKPQSYDIFLKALKEMDFREKQQ